METTIKNETTGSAKVVTFLKNPIILALIIGLAIRIVCAPLLTYEYDIYHWGVILENIDSGNDLYGLAGYYYTPVWGYLMGVIGGLQDLLLNIPIVGERFTNMLPIEDLAHVFHTATITNVSFNVAMKIPMIICDLFVGYLIYWLIKDRTANVNKASLGFLLWFLCPIVIYMSGIQAMFDSFSALFLVLTIILFYKGYYFFGGALFAIAVLTKFFPGFGIFVIIAFILVKHKDDGQAVKNLIMAIAGAAIMAIVLIVPQIIDGTVMDSLSFIFGRTSSYTEPIVAICVYGMIVVALILVVFFGYKMYRSDKENVDDDFLKYMLLAITSALLFSVSPQYPIVIIPLLIYYILSVDKGYLICLILIGIAAAVSAASMNNFALLSSASEFLGISSPDWIISTCNAFETKFLGITLEYWIMYTASILQYFGTVLIIAFHFEGLISKYPQLAFISKTIIKLKSIGGKLIHEV